MSGKVDPQLFDDLTWRGLIHQTTDENLPKWLTEGPRVVYAGFDPTAHSLHVGHLVALLTLRRFQKAGHRPIALIGGATGMIGDPSGRSDERNLLSTEELESNVQSIHQQMQSVLKFDDSQGAMLLNNFDWMKGYGYLTFLRDIGKNFPVNVMLSKDSVKSRLERTDSGLSYTEFSYMLLQAYDFVYLNKYHDCTLQIGGSDQWGNITAGIDLGRRMHGATLFGITSPLLTKKDGTKMGKTADGAVWLSPEKTSPYAFYQFWLNVGDEEVGTCLRYFTDLPKETIEELDQSRSEDAGRRESQKKLAEEVTRLIHGEAGLTKAINATETLFQGGPIENLTDKDLLEIFHDVPRAQIERGQLNQGELTIIDAFVVAGLCSSKGEARRLIDQGGARINNEVVSDSQKNLSPDDLASESVIVLKKGKKKFALLRCE
ncbi:Tyrosine--tRNA ligase [Planctomycetales bacterium 10988]|nr:Tyrosine--tRNA ligase [Planctomycetales bacterium 10988]